MLEFIKYLHHIDKDITFFINQLYSPLTDWIWQVFSNKYIWFGLYAVVLFFLYRNLGWKRATVALVAMILVVTCCDQLANVFKNGVQRLRPCCDGEMIRRGLHELNWHWPIEYGFFSGHAANSMGFAVGTSLCFNKLDAKNRNYRPYTIGILIWAFLVGMSRVFVGMHYLGDVAVGFAMGAAIAWVIVSIAAISAKKLGL